MGRVQLSDTSGPCDIIGVIQGERVEPHLRCTVQDGHMSDTLPGSAKKLYCPVSKELLQFYSLAFFCSNSGLQETSTEATNPL